MIRKVVHHVIFAVGLASIVIAIGQLIWPIFDSEGTVIDGGYRGIEIGDSKSDVQIGVTIPGRQKLKLSGFMNTNGRTNSLCSSSGGETIDESDVWLLAYPGIHKEVVKVTFADQRVVRIDYQRDILSP